MEQPLKILMLEDSEWDAELIQREIKKSGIHFIAKVVTNQSDYEIALNIFLPDLILSDHSLPSFSSDDAFEIYKSTKLNVPFILVTGAVSEEFAVLCLKKGVDDYVLKSNLIRLPSSIQHALKSKKTEIEKQRSQEELLKSEIQIRNFANYLNDAIEEERARISREIHDELGQQLTVIKISLSNCKKLEDVSEEMEEKIDAVLLDIDTTINSIKKIATELRPAILDTFGLMPAIDWMSKEFEKKTNISCHFVNSTKELEIQDKVSINVFRICQETLNNIAKHSGASKALIEVNKINNNLTLKISDNGKGIAGKNENSLSMGIIGMHERAKIIGADLNILSKPRLGTSVRLSVNI